MYVVYGIFVFCHGFVRRVFRNMFYLVDVAQLVRVPGCGPGGRRFDPDHPPHFFVYFYILGCRQVVRHRTLTPLSAGSNPAIPARIKHRTCGAFSFISLLNHADSNQPIGEADYNRCEVTLNEVQAANPAIPARKTTSSEVVFSMK